MFVNKKNLRRQKKLSKKLVIFSRILIFFGFFLIGISFLIFFLTFSPVLTQEVKYQINPPKKNIDEILPVDKKFSLIIPKIGANVKVIPNVNPYDEKVYQWQLTRGVAQAQGSVQPGETGNLFVFAHSSDNWYNANRYNAVFYLLNKLKKGDDIYFYYQGKKFHYQVSEIKLVDASAINYLSGKSAEPKVTLMTCWPPGTTLKRLIVIGKIIIP